MILELFISQLTYRLHTTLGSSVPSERVFSAMKLTHSRLCTTLTTERVDKLLYIQVNCRVLRRPLHPIKKQADEEEDILMNLEVEDLGRADEDEVGDVAYHAGRNYFKCPKKHRRDLVKSALIVDTLANK
jgi:hypothetical protein